MKIDFIVNAKLPKKLSKKAQQQLSTAFMPKKTLELVAKAAPIAEKTYKTLS